MESTKSYYLYKLEEKYTGQDWMTVIPSQYSIDGNGTMPRVLKSDHEEICDNNDYSKEYLTIESLENGNVIYWNASESSYTKTISASTDDGNTWTAYTSTTGGTTIATLNAGDKVLLKGLNSAYGTMYDRFNYFGATCQFKIYGNIMSLLYGDSFVDKTLLQLSYTFQRLFHNTNVVDASNLILPATTLMTDCYLGMFADCTNLTTAPELPATTLYGWCYQQMFSGCTSLTAAPDLPATALAERCYQSMFYGCTSLTTAPQLPATTLASRCYQWMFEGCTSLTTAPELPATTLANSCYNSMFRGCTSLTTAPSVLPATTLAYSCYGYMFAECTSLTTAPELPATTLTDYCYDGMFYECTSLTTAPELPATTLASWCYETMFYNCTSLNSITCLATDISATNCTNAWVRGVASSGTFVKASSMTGWTTGINGIPNNWTVQNA